MIWTNRRASIREELFCHLLLFFLFPFVSNQHRHPLPLQVQRCGAMEGEEGDEISLYFTSISHAGCMITQTETVRPKAGCHGVTVGGCLPPWPCPHHVAGEQGLVRRERERLCSGVGCSGGALLVNGGDGGRGMTLWAPPFCWKVPCEL